MADNIDTVNIKCTICGITLCLSESEFHSKSCIAPETTTIISEASNPLIQDDLDHG